MNYLKKLYILVQNFFESEEISRIMPGKKDFIFVRQGHQRVHVQKRLLLTNLKESYQLFKDKFPSKSVGFSKFADLHPKHCVLAGEVEHMLNAFAPSIKMLS